MSHPPAALNPCLLMSLSWACDTWDDEGDAVSGIALSAYLNVMYGLGGWQCGYPGKVAVQACKRRIIHHLYVPVQAY